MRRASLFLLLACAAISAGADSAPPAAARADADLLVRSGLHFAEGALKKQASDDEAAKKAAKKEGGKKAKQAAERTAWLEPFALVMGKDQRISRLQLAKHHGQRSSEELLDELGASLRARADAGEIVAVAIFSDVVISLPGGGRSDAIHAAWEHQGGVCADVFVPYTIHGADVRLEQQFETPRRAAVFQGCGEARKDAPARSEDTSPR